MGLKTTFREKLEWLEGSETLVLRMRAARLSRQAKEQADGLPSEPEGLSGPPLQ
jgi:hypothetical protein